VYVGSLFSGAGLGDLGLQRAGLKHRWFCECDPFARQILALRWPGVPVLEDVRHVRGAQVPAVDVLAGGFPCQDVSVAGKGAGVREGTRSGLWFEYLRIVREIRPRYVIVENVKALLGRGMSTVLGGLAESGYDAEWDVFPAAALGAPHLRERAVVVAYPHGHGCGLREPVFTPAGNLDNGRQADGPTDWRGVRLAGPRSQAALAAHRGPLVRRVDDGGTRPLDRLRVLGNGIVPDLMELVGRLVINHSLRA
jgi:DNA (cytosine-5)-methyltransferase 1